MVSRTILDLVYCRFVAVSVTRSEFQLTYRNLEFHCIKICFGYWRKALIRLNPFDIRRFSLYPLFKFVFWFAYSKYTVYIMPFGDIKKFINLIFPLSNMHDRTSTKTSQTKLMAN